MAASVKNFVIRPTDEDRKNLTESQLRLLEFLLDPSSPEFDCVFRTPSGKLVAEVKFENDQPLLFVYDTKGQIIFAFNDACDKGWYPYEPDTTKIKLSRLEAVKAFLEHKEAAGELKAVYNY